MQVDVLSAHETGPVGHGPIQTLSQRFGQQGNRHRIALHATRAQSHGAVIRAGTRRSGSIDSRGLVRGLPHLGAVLRYHQIVSGESFASRRISVGSGSIAEIGT